MYMQPYELDAWLGDTELTDEQRATFARMVEAIADRYPGREHGQHPDEESIAEAMSGAMQVMLGDDTLEGLSAAWQRARAAEREAMERLTGAIIASAMQGHTTLHQLTGFKTQPTIWLGTSTDWRNFEHRSKLDC